MYTQPAFFTIIPIIMVAVFIIVFVTAIAALISPRFRGMLMARQVRALRHATDMAKDDLSRSASNVAKAGIDAADEVHDSRGEELRNIASTLTDIKVSSVTGALEKNLDGIRDIISTASDAVKGTGSEGDASGKIFCKYCGAQVDGDSLFCKKCGRKL